MTHKYLTKTCNFFLNVRDSFTIHVTTYYFAEVQFASNAS